MVRPVNAIRMDPLPRFFFCELHFLINSNAVWNTMLMDKAFFKSMDGIFGRSTGLGCGRGRGVQITSRVSTPVGIKCFTLYIGSSPV